MTAAVELVCAGGHRRRHAVTNAQDFVRVTRELMKMRLVKCESCPRRVLEVRLLKPD